MITIIDYGLGNIRAFANIYQRLNIEFQIAKKKEDIYHAQKLILPGVGAFDNAINLLNSSGMRDIIEKKVIEEQIPVLGVCVGMQIMANTSDEGNLQGLGWFNAEVRVFDVKKINFKPHIPHMGWNSIIPVKDNLIFTELKPDSRFYFLHSYYFECKEKSNELSVTNYGINFTSSVVKNNIYGFQFHPEKSHNNGILVLKNFATLI
ncbi:MAG: imidazole glycerol phosphate synthase subunit HisH [Deltaproteobacteria bacterium]